MSSTPTRGWAGTTLADRRAARRARVLDAGLDLLGTQGSAAVTVRSVCRLSGLTDRYFYESFADRDELLLAVYDRVAEQAGAAIVAAVADAGSGVAADPERTARAALEAFLAVLVDDPRKGRVLLLEPLTDPTLGVRGAVASAMFVDLVRAQLDADAPVAPVSGPGAELTATALVGALANLFIRWLDGTLHLERAELVDYCVRLLVTCAELARLGGECAPTGARSGGPTT